MEVSEITKAYMNNIENIFIKKYNNEIFYLLEYCKQNKLLFELREFLKELRPENFDDESQAFLFGYY